MQPAAPRDQIVAGPQIQVVGVAQQDLGAERFEIACVTPFTAPCVPTGMNAGVSHVAVRRRHHAAARAAVGVRDAEGEG